MREEKAVYQLEAVSAQSLPQQSAQLISVNISPAESDLTSCHSWLQSTIKTTLLNWRKYTLTDGE